MQSFAGVVEARHHGSNRYPKNLCHLLIGVPVEVAQLNNLPMSFRERGNSTTDPLPLGFGQQLRFRIRKP